MSIERPPLFYLDPCPGTKGPRPAGTLDFTRLQRHHSALALAGAVTTSATAAIHLLQLFRIKFSHLISFLKKKTKKDLENGNVGCVYFKKSLRCRRCAVVSGALPPVRSKLFRFYYRFCIRRGTRRVPFGGKLPRISRHTVRAKKFRKGKKSSCAVRSLSVCRLCRAPMPLRARRSEAIGHVVPIPENDAICRLDDWRRNLATHGEGVNFS